MKKSLPMPSTSEATTKQRWNQPSTRKVPGVPFRMSESAQRRNASACAMSAKNALNEAFRAPREAVAKARYPIL